MTLHDVLIQNEVILYCMYYNITCSEYSIQQEMRNNGAGRATVPKTVNMKSPPTVML